MAPFEENRTSRSEVPYVIGPPVDEEKSRDVVVQLESVHWNSSIHIQALDIGLGASYVTLASSE
ncbi:MAG: hypothetical protein JRN43_04030 [Nitrososphaerota archaeon]|nr:hypothetical protein [Nitrososphaerota archaeon]MDG7019468.1 hypothetical protein [Nitrososphaerota archaeon]